MVLLRELSGLLELLILGLVLGEHADKLFLLFDLHLGLRFVGFHLFLEFFRLTIYLSSQSFLDVRLFATLLTQLRRHQLHFLSTFFFEVLVLAFELGGLLLD